MPLLRSSVSNPKPPSMTVLPIAMTPVKLKTSSPPSPDSLPVTAALLLTLKTSAPLLPARSIVAELTTVKVSMSMPPTALLMPLKTSDCPPVT